MSSHAQQSVRPRPPTCPDTPARPVRSRPFVWSRPLALSSHAHPFCLVSPIHLCCHSYPGVAMPTPSGHTHPSVQPRPPWWATLAHPVWSRAVVLCSHAYPSVEPRPPHRATPTRPVRQPGAPLTHAHKRCRRPVPQVCCVAPLCCPVMASAPPPGERQQRQS